MKLGLVALAGSGQSYKDSSDSSRLPFHEALRTESLRVTTGNILKPGYLCHYADIPETEKQSGLSPTAKERRGFSPDRHKMLSKERAVTCGCSRERAKGEVSLGSQALGDSRMCALVREEEERWMRSCEAVGNLKEPG